MDKFEQTVFESYSIRKKDGYDAFVKNDVMYLFWNTPDFSGLNAVRSDSITKEKLQEIKKITQGYNFSVGLKRKADDGLSAQGLRYEKTAKIMSWSPKVGMEYKSELVIRRVENKKGLLKWAGVCAEAFDMDAEYLFNSCKGDLTIPEVVYFYGEIDGEAVGAIQSVKGADACGLFWVAVKEQYRRRNYGYDLMAAAINEAMQTGYKNFMLSASDTGYFLYKKIGFEVLYERYDYELK